MTQYLRQLARLYIKQDRRAEAEPLVDRCVAVSEKNASLIGNREHDAYFHIDVAGLYEGIGNYEAAQTYYERAIQELQQLSAPWQYEDRIKETHKSLEGVRAKRASNQGAG